MTVIKNVKDELMSGGRDTFAREDLEWYVQINNGGVAVAVAVDCRYFMLRAIERVIAAMFRGRYVAVMDE